jgi:hypothetical protein
MKKIIALLLFTCLAFSCLQKTSKQDKTFGFSVSQEFVQGSEDIPLLVGMEKISDDSLGFDSNSGSVINSSYTSKTSLRKTKDFYLKTLPEMGWEVYKNSHDLTIFKRENEKLEIEFDNKNGLNVVRFFISSAI